MSESTLTPAPTPAMTREECIRWNEREADREAAEAEVCREEQCTSDAEDAEERAASYSATAAMLRSDAARIKALEEALRPFAELAAHFPGRTVCPTTPGPGEPFYRITSRVQGRGESRSRVIGQAELTVDDLHRAAALLNPESRS